MFRALDQASGFGCPDEALGLLIGAHERDSFFSDVFEQRPKLFEHGDPLRYSSLISSAEIDAFVALTELDDDSIRMVRAEPPVSSRDYVFPSGIVDPLRIRDLQRSGATMILNQLNRYCPALGAFCRALEAVFTCRVQTNVYLTPPGAQGFPAHYDSHDVFVIQVEGAKAWSLYAAPVHLAYRGESFEAGEVERGEPTQTLTLNPGDALYVPRGRMHDAIGGEEGTSLHVTVGLIAKTWSDLMLEAVGRVAVEDEGFRHSLPPGYARQDFDRDTMRAKFAELTERIAERIEMDAALDVLVRDFVVVRRPYVAADSDTRMPAIDAGSTLCLHPGLVCRLEEHGEELILLGNGRRLAWSPSCRDALVRVISGDAVRMRDLADALPESEAWELGRRLVEAGLVEVR